MQSPRGDESDVELLPVDSTSSSSSSYVPLAPLSGERHDLVIHAGPSDSPLDDATPYVLQDDELGGIIPQIASSAAPDSTVNTVDGPPGGIPFHIGNRIEIQRSALARREAERGSRQQTVTSDLDSSQTVVQEANRDDNVDPLHPQNFFREAAARAARAQELRRPRGECERCREKCDTCLWRRTKTRWYHWYNFAIILHLIALAILQSLPLWNDDYKLADAWLWQWRQPLITDVQTVNATEKCPKGYVQTGPNEYSVSLSGTKYRNTQWCDKRICIKRSENFKSYSDVWKKTSCYPSQEVCPTGGCVEAGKTSTDCPITGVIFELSATSEESDPARELTCGGQTFTLRPERRFASEGDPDPDKRFAPPFLGFISTVNDLPVANEKPGSKFVYRPENPELGPMFTFQKVTSRLARDFYDDNDTPVSMRRYVDEATDQVHLFAVYPMASSHDCRNPGKAVDDMRTYTDRSIRITFTTGLLVSPDGTRLILVWALIHIAILVLIYVLSIDVKPSDREHPVTTGCCKALYLLYPLVVWLQTLALWRYGKNVQLSGCIMDPFVDEGYSTGAPHFQDAISDMTNHLTLMYTVTTIVGCVLGLQGLYKAAHGIRLCIRYNC